MPAAGVVAFEGLAHIVMWEKWERGRWVQWWGMVWFRGTYEYQPNAAHPRFIIRESVHQSATELWELLQVSDGSSRCQRLSSDANGRMA